MESTSCPIWKTPATKLRSPRDGDLIDSPRAGGRYLVFGTALPRVRKLSESERVLLTSWLVEQRRQGHACPFISTTTRETATSRSPLSTHDRADGLLRYLGDQSSVLSEAIKFKECASTEVSEAECHLLAWTASLQISEVIWLAQYCRDKGWIDYSVKEPAESRHDVDHELTLVPQGAERLAELDGHAS